MQKVVLEHVAQHTGLVVVAGSVANVDILGHRDLHMVHVVAVPDGLENGVAKAEEQDVLRGLLPQIVVNAVDLVFLEDGMEGMVEPLRGGQIMAKRLLDDDAPPCVRLVIHMHRAQAFGDGRVERRRGRHIIQPVGRAALHLAEEGPEMLIVAGRVEVAPRVPQLIRENFPGLSIEGVAGKLPHPFSQPGSEFLAGIGAAGEADHPRAGR